MSAPSISQTTYPSAHTTNMGPSPKKDANVHQMLEPLTLSHVSRVRPEMLCSAQTPYPSALTRNMVSNPRELKAQSRRCVHPVRDVHSLINADSSQCVYTAQRIHNLHHCTERTRSTRRYIPFPQSKYVVYSAALQIACALCRKCAICTVYIYIG